MNRQKLLSAVLMCFGFSLVNAAAQTQPAAGPPAAAPTTNPPPAKVAAATPVAAAPLPDPHTPEEFFARARALNDLEASGIPFHLKATYVASGDAEFTGNGNYEEWWQSENHWRRQASLGGYQYVSVQDGSRKTTYASSKYMPLRLIQTMGASLIHIDPKTEASRDWTLSHQKVKGTDYILLTSPYECLLARHPAACTTKEFFSPDGMIRIEADRTFIQIYNSFQPFHGLFIPRDITVAYEEKPILTISVSDLESLSPNDPHVSNEAPIPAGLLPIFTPWDARSQPDYKQVKVVQSGPPTYPEYAREERIEGTVVVRVSIDEQGNIREPYIYQSAVEPMLDRSALDCVRQWKFRPATIGGAPTTAIMTFVFPFHLRY
jgi:TonB family protein